MFNNVLVTPKLFVLFFFVFSFESGIYPQVLYLLTSDLACEDDVYLLLSQLLLPISEYGVFECCGR